MNIVAVGELNPAAYNPRRSDPQRLDLIEVSLRKLGWLLPIVAEPGGEILSGHQRHHVAIRMGATHVPVHRTRVFTLQERKGLNLVFNRATNDLREKDTPKSLTEALGRLDIGALAARVPDRDIHDPSWFRCEHAESVPLGDLTAANKGRWLNYALAAAKPLRIKGIEMPLVATRDLVVVNGIGRLQDAAEQGTSTMRVVFVTEDEAALANAFMNLLTMDFDVHGRYADELRHNSFRRMRTRGRIRSSGRDTNLGKGFTIALPNAVQKDFSIARAADRKAFRELHGETILDFGAGRLEDTAILNAHGFDATGFEPFVPAEGKDFVDTELSRDVGRRFLARVADGTRWSSIVLASVLNSVPFKDDRRKIIALIASLATSRTVVFASSAGLQKEALKHVAGAARPTANTMRTQFSLGYEENTLIGEISKQPKVQKYHRAEEFAELWRERFEAVKVWEAKGLVNVICRRPKPVDAAELVEAIRFEFDLPHPDGQRLGLADEAIAAWESRRRALST